MGHIDLDDVARLVRATGHHAHVEQTGGNVATVATVMIGQSYIDSAGDERWTLLLGPGHYSWGRGPNTGHTDELCWGPDDGGDGVMPATYATDDTTAESLARDIVAALTGRVTVSLTMSDTTRHTDLCLARAMVCAVENARDSDNPDFTLHTVDVRAVALGYLADGTASCYCPDMTMRDLR